MNNKTNTWAAIVGSATLSEAVQRVAFSFGYKWPNGYRQGEIVATGYPVLFFNPEDKTISFGFDRTVSDKACKVCTTFDQVMELFKNPPKVVKELEKFRLSNGSILYKDGSCLFNDGIRTFSISSADMDEAIKVRSKLMGKEEKKSMAPVVRFRYDSPSSGQKLRSLMVLEDSVDSYSGLDMEDNNLFKRFRKDRIVGAVMFVGFSEVKDY